MWKCTLHLIKYTQLKWLIHWVLRYIDIYMCSIYIFVQPPQFKPRHMFVAENISLSPAAVITLFTPIPGTH